MGITELLTVAFVVLKIVGVIDWSIWLCILPELIAVGIYVLITILYFGFFFWATRS